MITYDRDPQSVADWVLQAEQWALDHPTQQVGSRPMILLQQCNDLVEGDSIVPTVADQGQYLQQIARVIPNP